MQSDGGGGGSSGATTVNEPEVTSPSVQSLSPGDLHCYNLAKKCIEEMALYLKPFSNGSIGSLLSRPMQRKLVTLVNCQLVEDEGRSRALRAARSLGERTVTELILQHQNPQQLSANLWAAVRARGCQFLGPAMQEEVLKLVLLALEDGSALSRKVLVMFVVQRLEPHFPQASKTSIGHVVQLLYRASCFKVSKRDGDSSLMQLKEEFRTYDALRREHDAQIVQIATEAGLRIAPDQWSALLYGDTGHKSHMQSIIDKLQTPQSFLQSVQELLIALQRTGDPANLAGLRQHLKLLANIDPSAETSVPTWREVAESLDAVKQVVVGLVVYVQHHGSRKLQEPGNTTHNPKYKISMCRDLTTRSTCPRGPNCTFAHSDDELERFRAKSRKISARTPTVSLCKDSLDYINDHGGHFGGVEETSPMRYANSKSLVQPQYVEKPPSKSLLPAQQQQQPILSPNHNTSMQQMNRIPFDQHSSSMKYPPPPPMPRSVINDPGRGFIGPQQRSPRPVSLQQQPASSSVSNYQTNQIYPHQQQHMLMNNYNQDIAYSNPTYSPPQQAPNPHQYHSVPPPTDYSKLNPRQLEVMRQNVMWEQQRQQQQQQQQSLPPGHPQQQAHLPPSMISQNHLSNTSPYLSSQPDHSPNNNNNNHMGAAPMAIQRLQSLEMRKREILKELEKYKGATNNNSSNNNNNSFKGTSLTTSNMNGGNMYKNPGTVTSGIMNNNNNPSKEDLMLNYWNVNSLTPPTASMSNNLPPSSAQNYRAGDQQPVRDLFVRSDSILDDDYVPFDLMITPKYGPISRMSAKSQHHSAGMQQNNSLFSDGPRVPSSPSQSSLSTGGVAGTMPDWLQNFSKHQNYQPSDHGNNATLNSGASLNYVSKFVGNNDSQIYHQYPESSLSIDHQLKKVELLERLTNRSKSMVQYAADKMVTDAEKNVLTMELSLIEQQLLEKNSDSTKVSTFLNQITF